MVNQQTNNSYVDLQTTKQNSWFSLIFNEKDVNKYTLKYTYATTTRNQVKKGQSKNIDLRYKVLIVWWIHRQIIRMSVYK